MLKCVLCLPLQAVSGNGSPLRRPSKCCRATNLYTPSTCGGCSSAAPPPTGTASSQLHQQTTSTLITAQTPTRLPRGHAGLSLQTGLHLSLSFAQQPVQSPAWIYWLLTVVDHLYLKLLIIAARLTKAAGRTLTKTKSGRRLWSRHLDMTNSWTFLLTLFVKKKKECLIENCMNVVFGFFYFT